MVSRFVSFLLLKYRRWETGAGQQASVFGALLQLVHRREQIITRNENRCESFSLTYRSGLLKNVSNQIREHRWSTRLSIYPLIDWSICWSVSWSMQRKAPPLLIDCSWFPGFMKDKCSRIRKGKNEKISKKTLQTIWLYLSVLFYDGGSRQHLLVDPSYGERRTAN